MSYRYSVLLGIRIKEILKDKGMTQRELAQKMGFGDAYISKIVHGQVNLTLETIERFEKALQVKLILIL